MDSSILIAEAVECLDKAALMAHRASVKLNRTPERALGLDCENLRNVARTLRDAVKARETGIFPSSDQEKRAVGHPSA